MRKKPEALRFALAGLLAGCVTGIFGAGGGMVLVALLSGPDRRGAREVFATSLAIMLAISAVALFAGPSGVGSLPRGTAAVCLFGAAGGLISGLLFRRIPGVWLHRMMGALLVFGCLRRLFGWFS